MWPFLQLHFPKGDLEPEFEEVKGNLAIIISLLDYVAGNTREVEEGFELM